MINKIERELGEQIVNKEAVYGGCIANSRIITSKSGNKYFLKTKSGFPDMFLKEANGLIELAKADCIRVPRVIMADKEFLLIEFIEQGSKGSDFFEKFGRSFAKMHKYTSEQFGFYQDNYIGATVQYNTAENNYTWAEFYYNKRIMPQYKMLENKGLATEELTKYVIKLESVINRLLQGSEEAPSLMHGDLWSGNYMCDSMGNAVIFDPAVYYGHRELDIAMTKMFGGFGYDFYSAYQEEYPLPYAWQEREKLYLLYHYMNHLNLFGNSYYGSVISILRDYL